MTESTNMNSSKEVLNIIVERLKSEDFLNDFEYHISSKAFVYKTPGEKLIVELDPYTTDYLISCDGDKPTVKDIHKSIVIRPCVGKRFEIVHKWFEIFTFHYSVRDQRSWDSIGFSGRMLGFEQENFFYLDLSNFEEQYKKVVYVIKYMCSFMNTNFRTLEQLYKYTVKRVIDGKESFPKSGDVWIYDYLAITRVVAPKNYNLVKKRVLEHVEQMNYSHEPNIEICYPHLNEIISYLESYKFK